MWLLKVSAVASLMSSRSVHWHHWSCLATNICTCKDYLKRFLQRPD